MQNPVTVITDKVAAMLKSMVYMAMRVSYRRGATATELSGFLHDWAPSASEMFHEGMVERVLQDLHRDGKVTQAGARWYPVGLAH
ncbi:MAG: hypothetical protein V7700_00750 [Halioglobus sp.]